MAWVKKGRTQFNKEALKGADLPELIEAYKQIESAENVQSAWEDVNGKYKPPVKKKSSKTNKED